ncbi:M57 family metalloprotease [Pendulispora albinea]|uniref:M57 family metalloprotease n=1 Tax=Pendulispora albinea TaxID=2741071 RepID=A0ABZ2M8G7_9BACT
MQTIIRASKHIIQTSRILGLGLALLGAMGCADTEPSYEGKDVAPLTYEEFRAQTYREPDTGVFIVNGDTPVETEEQLRDVYADYVRSFEKAKDPEVGTTRQPLAVNRIGEKDDRWSYVRQRNITYCVSTAFGDKYNAVVGALREATSTWRQSISIYFQHRSDQDATCTASNTNVTFDVRPVTAQPYLARAFLPSSTRPNRNILIDASAFGNIVPYTLAGVLRHEVGHTLGFRHEHTRPEAGACFEDNNWRALTPYDAYSVMHYPPCNGANRKDLTLTFSDTSGAHPLYGPKPVLAFDATFYINGYSDLVGTFGSNWDAVTTHWYTTGVVEGRRASTDFDPVYYLAIHPDLRNELGEKNYKAAVNHWYTVGIMEGRRASREFDVRYYLNANPDLKAVFGTNYDLAARHWSENGMFEGRRASSEFDVRYYLSRYADLRTAFGDTNYPAAIDHWIRHGFAEGRRGVP